MNAINNFIIIIIFIIFPFISYATTYYVSDQGNNKNSGDSWESSWRTLDHASKFLYPGDTLIIRKSKKPYTYLPVMRSGSQNLPITIKGELSSDPPVITGAVQQLRWEKFGNELWVAKTTAEPHLVLEDEFVLEKATNPNLKPGTWFWENDIFYYKPSNGTAYDHSVFRTSMGGGVQIGDNSWIRVENLSCWYGKGSCVSIKKGSHNIVDNVSAYFYSRGFEINGGIYNVIQNSRAEFNKDGVYLLNSSSYNEIRDCKILYNGRLDLWSSGDRAGIAIGDSGTNMYNKVINNEVAFNGGPMSDPALIAYRAPHTLIDGNYIHNNYGSGMFVTISSDNSLVKNNVVELNGGEAHKSGQRNISGLSVRRSKNVTVENNVIKNNTVAGDGAYVNVDKGPRGGLDLRGNAGDDMQNIKFINNVVCGTKNGPNIYIHDVPNIRGFYISPNEYLKNQFLSCDQ